LCPTLRNVGERVGGGGGCIGPNIMGATASHPSCSGGALGSRGQRYLQGKVWMVYLSLKFDVGQFYVSVSRSA
jgi:hypothetical protein